MGGREWTTKKKEFIPGLLNPSGPFLRNLSNGYHLFYDRTASGLKHFGWGKGVFGDQFEGGLSPAGRGKRGELEKATSQSYLGTLPKSWFPNHSHTS